MVRSTQRGLNQKAVLWMANGFGDDGSVIVSAAVEIDVRWEERQREALDAQGNVIAIDARVVIDQDIVVGSILWLGAEEDLATPPVELKQVVLLNKTPTLRRGRSQIYRRTVDVIRYSDTLPTIA